MRTGITRAAKALLLALSSLSVANPTFAQVEPPNSGLWADPLYFWIQAIGVSRYSVRAIVAANQYCPYIQINKNTRPMQLRAVANMEFPINVCELPLTSGADALQVQIGRHLVKVTSYIYRVAAIGETQSTFSSADQFKKVITSLESAPMDLLVHTGNYINASDSQIPSEEQTSGWQLWEKQWFSPTRFLMGQSPLLLNRGPNEDCEHSVGWQGWNLFFSPHPFRSQCEMGSDSFYVNLPGFSAVALDTTVKNGTPEGLLFSKQQDFLRWMKSNYDFLLQKNSTWFITNKPVWIEPNTNLSVSQDFTRWREVMSPWVMAYANQIVSGSELSAAAIKIKGYPMQYIVGNSNIINPNLAQETFRTIDTAMVEKHFRVKQSGFTLFSHAIDQINVWKPEWHLLSNNQY